RVFRWIWDAERRPSRQSYSPLVGHGHRSSPASPEVRADHAEGAVREESSDLLSAGPSYQHDDRRPAYVAAAAGAEPGLICTFAGSRQFAQDSSLGCTDWSNPAFLPCPTSHFWYMSPTIEL